MFKQMKEEFDRVKLEMSRKKEAKSAKSCEKLEERKRIEALKQKIG